MGHVDPQPPAAVAAVMTFHVYYTLKANTTVQILSLAAMEAGAAVRPQIRMAHFKKPLPRL